MFFLLLCFFGGDSSWKPNLGAFTERVGRHPSRIENMHFTFLFLLRALNRLLPYLKNQTWDTGDIAQDNYTKVISFGMNEEKKKNDTCAAIRVDERRSL